CCIAGHRSYTWGSFFSRLDELEAGNEILVDRSGITYTYIVEETFVVAPEDTWVLSETEDARITLITCTPVRVATHRLIVRAVLTGD
ncbi:MAG TPA: sortase, partial [Clostridiales bacterium]|nr:sortase [Clostridiales bacterium]